MQCECEPDSLSLYQLSCTMDYSSVTVSQVVLQMTTVRLMVSARVCRVLVEIGHVLSTMPGYHGFTAGEGCSPIVGV